MLTEPVRLTSLVTAAVNATLAILLFLDVDPELVGALTAAAAAWVVVVFELVRQRVTPLVRPEDEDGTPLVRVDAV